MRSRPGRDGEERMRKADWLGPSIQIDPAFAYYRDRSADSVARELKQAGYRSVRYFVTREDRVDGRLVEALKRHGLFVWAMTLGNGTYVTGHLPAGWERWRMELLKPAKDGYTRLSPHSEGYLDWKRQALVRLAQEHPFDGLEIAEAYFPEWDGLATGTYGDVGPLALAAFRSYSGMLPPEFVHRTSPAYYKKDRARYRAWVEFRVHAVNRFLARLVNGPGGIREARPELRIATWSIAVDAGRDPVDAVRELQGIDAGEMIAAVRPDLHVLQTHWPDWMRRRLPADYARRYRTFAEPLRRLYPELPLALQTDIGSLRQMQRSAAWTRRFAETAKALGYASWTAYEYSIGGWMYEEPPRAVKATRLGRDSVRIDFNKRIDAASAERTEHYRIRSSQGEPAALPDLSAAADGQSVTLRSDLFPAEPFTADIRGVRDTPGRWLVPGCPANLSDCSIVVPGLR